MLDAETIRWGEVLEPPGPWDALIHRAATAESIAARTAGVIVYVATPQIEGVTQGGRWRLELSADAEMRAAHVLHLLVRAGCAALVPAVMWASMSQAAVAVPRRARVDPLCGASYARWSLPLRSAAAAVVVPDLPGWRVSQSVWRDVVWALQHTVPVHFMGAQ